LRHDLRNPLSVILGRCELLLSGAAGPLSDRQRNSLDAVVRNATRMQVELEYLVSAVPSDVLEIELPERS